MGLVEQLAGVLGDGERLRFERARHGDGDLIVVATGETAAAHPGYITADHPDRSPLPIPRASRCSSFLTTGSHRPFA
jgi:hypothetical protein